MAEERAIEDMSGSELLDHVDALARTQRETELKILLAARQHAVINNADTVEPWQLKVPGGERARRFGGDGTPLVAEFSAAAFGARLGLSSYAGREVIADALDLTHRLPRLWERVQGLEVKATYARFVARKTRDLTKDQADYVDERVVESADGRISWTRFETLVEAAIKAADPGAAAEREEAEHRRQFANPTQSDGHGMRGFYIRGSFAVIAKLDAAVAYFALALLHLGDTSSDDERRVKAVLILANPVQAVNLLKAYQQWLTAGSAGDSATGDPATADRGARPEVDYSKLLPGVTVYVHLYGGPDSTGIARVDGHGPVTEKWVRDHLGPRAKFTIRPVEAIEGQAPVDAYEVPDRHRRAVHLMTPADTFPHANSLSRSHQIDHTERYVHGAAAKGTGQSRVGNYGPMTITHHRIKTFGGWEARQPFPGIYVWRDPYGAIYLVDHTGTRRVAQPGEGSGTSSRIEVCFSDILLEWAA